MTLRCWIVWSWCAAVLFISVGWGCERQAAQNRAPGEIRIASLSPAMTTTLQQVGLGPLMVGRSAFCADVDELPVVGDLQHINAEQLVRVNPSHIFVQRSGDAVDGILQQLAQKHGWVVVSQSIVDLPDVIRLMDRIATLFAHKDVAQKCHVLSGQISDALQKTPGEQSIRVLIISADQSPLAWGRDTYLGQLVDAAGGENVMAGNRWTSLSLEDVVRLKADIVIVPTGVEPVDLRALEAAVEPNRIHVLFFPSIDIPGPHLASLRPAIERILREASVKAP